MLLVACTELKRMAPCFLKQPLSIAVTHGERLLASVDALLRAAGWALADVEGLAVAIGPGSFTGLRIGVSTLKALAFATGRPLVGVPTLDGLGAVAL